jgi:hypothetical protein
VNLRLKLPERFTQVCKSKLKLGFLIPWIPWISLGFVKILEFFVVFAC